MGTLLGEDSKCYTFRRGDVREVYHDLLEGAPVAFEPGKNLSATQVRLCSNGSTSSVLIVLRNAATAQQRPEAAAAITRDETVYATETWVSAVGP